MGGNGSEKRKLPPFHENIFRALREDWSFSPSLCGIDLSDELNSPRCQATAVLLGLLAGSHVPEGEARALAAEVIVEVVVRMNLADPDVLPVAAEAICSLCGDEAVPRLKMYLDQPVCERQRNKEILLQLIQIVEKSRRASDAENGKEKSYNVDN